MKTLLTLLLLCVSMTANAQLLKSGTVQLTTSGTTKLTGSNGVLLVNDAPIGTTVSGTNIILGSLKILVGGTGDTALAVSPANFTLSTTGTLAYNPFNQTLNVESDVSFNTVDTDGAISVNGGSLTIGAVSGGYYISGVGVASLESVTATSFHGDGSSLTNLSAAQLSGTLSVSHGGTGISTLTGIPYGTGTAAFGTVTTGSNLSLTSGTLAVSGTLPFARLPAAVSTGTGVIYGRQTGGSIVIGGSFVTAAPVSIGDTFTTAATVNLAGDFTAGAAVSLTPSGSSLTMRTLGATDVTLPTSGTLATLTSLTGTSTTPGLTLLRSGTVFTLTGTTSLLLDGTSTFSRHGAANLWGPDVGGFTTPNGNVQISDTAATFTSGIFNATSGLMTGGTLASVLITSSTANGLTETGTTTTVNLYATSSGSTRTISFNSTATYFPVQIGEYSASTLSNIQTFHANPAVVGGLVTPTDFLITPKSFSTNPWSGMTILGSSSNAWPYVEFLAGRGTLSAPTATVTNDLIGEVAGIGVTGTNYLVSSLIDMRVIGTSLKGQIEFTIADSAGAFDQTAPEFLFNATGAYLNGVIRMGDNRTLNTFTNGAQIRNANANSNLNMVRDTAANYVYTSYTPEVSIDATHPHWGSGLYASTYDYTIWTYDGSSNVKRLTINPSTGTFVINNGATVGQNLSVSGTNTLGSGGTSMKNVRHGISGAMTLGTVTVTDTGCTANTRYFFSAHSLGTISIPGGYYASTRTSGTSFVITSSQATETSTIDWMGIEP